jgi:hypothetical protein
VGVVAGFFPTDIISLHIANQLGHLDREAICICFLLNGIGCTQLEGVLKLELECTERQHVLGFKAAMLGNLLPSLPIMATDRLTF